MAQSRKETTISIRKFIIFHHSSGNSVRNIAKLVHLSHSTVQHVIKRFKEENRIENKVRKGRPAKLTERDQRFVIRKFVNVMCVSALKVSAEFNENFSAPISPETVRRVLRSVGLNGRFARRKFFVSAKNRKLMLSFAKSMLNKPETNIAVLTHITAGNIMEPFSSDVLWILILGFIVGFFLAFGVGANDVANSFGTSVGSKALTLRQACILATIFEILGSVLMGYKVSDTVRKGIFDVEIFSEFEKELMLGFLASLIGSATWNIVATFFRWPISGTHSIIGAVVGFAVVARGFMGIKWKMLGKIVASWFLSPVLSGLISSAIFLLVKKLILSKDNAIDRGYYSLPFFWGITIFLNLFSVIHGGPHYLGFDVIPAWGVLILTGGIGLIFGVCVWYILVPYLQHSAASIGDSENSENQIDRDDLPTKIPYPEAENPGFEENGHEIPLGMVSSSYSLDMTTSNNTSVSTLQEDLNKKIHTFSRDSKALRLGYSQTERISKTKLFAPRDIPLLIGINSATTTRLHMRKYSGGDHIPRLLAFIPKFAASPISGTRNSRRGSLQFLSSPCGHLSVMPGEGGLSGFRT
ncbi:Sodium-dependent phosphate transporter 1-A [Araneus ventricosus]|uniref:Phosphate transporter n=1 Tax=Araneus ventricosus TaxID=182803 RepID=A0A4Y2FYA8_ARAVE|nr:Sodium-dependent phosphate transporter 1-A [Araneus ventricosus]